MTPRPPLTPEEIARLEALALAATKGPWRAGVPTPTNVVDAKAREVASTDYITEDGGTHEEARLNAVYIAAMDPDTTLALLAEVTALRAQLAAAERERDEAQAEHTREVLLRTVAERERDEARARAAVSERFRAEDAHSHIVESAGYAEHRKTLLARAEAAEARAAQAVDDWLATRIAELDAEIKALPPYPYPGQDRRTPERDERDRKEGWLYGQFGALRAEQLRRRQ